MPRVEFKIGLVLLREKDGQSHIIYVGAMPHFESVYHIT